MTTASSGSSGDTVVTATTMAGTRTTVVVAVETTAQDTLASYPSQLELIVGTTATSTTASTAPQVTTPATITAQGMVVAVGGSTLIAGKSDGTTITASSVKNGQPTLQALIGTGKTPATTAKTIFVKVDRVGDVLKTSYSTTGKMGSYIGIASKRYAKDSLGSSVGVTVRTRGTVAPNSVHVTTSSPLNR